MLYLEIIKYFGSKLSDPNFQEFLKSISCDPNDYDVSRSSYIISKTINIELGFSNNEAIYDEDEQIVLKEGIPIFTLFNIQKYSEIFFDSLPFQIKFTDNRNKVRQKAGQPIKSIDFEEKFLKKRFIIDHFLNEDFTISVDYDINETVEQIQIRSNSNEEEHLKL